MSCSITQQIMHLDANGYRTRVFGRAVVGVALVFNLPGCAAPAARVAPVQPPPAAQQTSAPTVAPEPAMRPREVSLPLVLRQSVVAHGVRFILTGRTHKELAGPRPTVHGVWDMRVERDGAAPLNVHVADTRLYAEGAGLGVTWVLRGEYDQEQVDVQAGESAPLKEADRRARASTAAGGSGKDDDWPQMQSEANGVYTADFARSGGTMRVRLGLYTGKVLAVEAIP